MSDSDPLLAAIEGSSHEVFAGIESDTVVAGRARVKRLVYPPGFRWSTDVQPIVGGERCMHAHVGFLARGRLQGEFGDGCGFEFTAPAGVVIEPGHDAWVVGDEPAVFIQFDFETDTVDRLGVFPHEPHA